MEHTQFYVGFVLVYDRNGRYYPDQRDYFVFLVLLTENAQKGSLVDCQEDVPYTALTIV